MRVAILDMNEGKANQGMRCIREILNQFAEYNAIELEKDEFEVRLRNEVPDLSYDVYISSGGPGSPLESEGSVWENKFFDWIEDVLAYNRNEANVIKKQVFFICHSFQLACRFFDIAEVNKRKSTSFGVFPVHYIGELNAEPCFKGLNDPFYVVDSRDYQVIRPNHNRVRELGAEILLIEKARPHVPLERAIMGIRFNDYMIGTQFHPEADPVGMSIHLQSPERRQTIVDNYGEEKLISTLNHLNDPDKIFHTYAHILPNFLNEAVQKMQMVEV